MPARPPACPPCSYICYLSSFGDGSSKGTVCWLSGKPDGEPGSQCFGFPNDWLGGGGSEAAPAPSEASTPAEDVVAGGMVMEWAAGGIPWGWLGWGH